MTTTSYTAIPDLTSTLVADRRARLLADATHAARRPSLASRIHLPRRFRRSAGAPVPVDVATAAQAG